MAEKPSDRRIESRPLSSPAEILAEFPLDDSTAASVGHARTTVTRIVAGVDDRLLVVVGPCSIHDPAAALDYALRLREAAKELSGELCIVMRAYLEKPRTTTGWKGLINDPGLDDSCDGEEGVRLARQLLLRLNSLGLPVACEFLDPLTPQFLADTVTWGAIGARTTESQVHRQLASGLPMPVGFKNGTDGNIQAALDAVRSATARHTFFGVTEGGSPTVVTTAGNPDGHVILRGGRDGPNYHAAHVEYTLQALSSAGLPERLVIDASHGNSGKDYRCQPRVTADVGDQLARGQTGIVGVMLESFLVDGRQDRTRKDDLVYGQSITDACMGWDMTVPVLGMLAEAVRERRRTVGERGAVALAAATLSGN